MDDDDDAVQQLILTLILIFLATAVILRRAITITRTTPVASPTPPTISVTDPAIIRSMLVDHADVFSNRPLAPFPVDYDARRPGRPSHSINIVPHGPLWRALRCNLSSGVLHRSQLPLVAPLHHHAVHSLLSSLSSAASGGSGGGLVVLIRDALHTAVFGVCVRLCFGDGVVGDGEMRAMQGDLREFFDNIVEARSLAAAPAIARLLRWRWWRRFGSTFDRLIQHFLPLVAARQRRQQSPCGEDGDRDSIRRPYVDSLIDLRVPDVKVDGGGNGAVAGGEVRRRSLTEHEMASLIWEFVSAATETAVTCVEWTLAHLITHPEIQEKLYREIAAAAGDGDGAAIPDETLRDLPYLRAVIQESLRLHPPVPFIVRDVAAAVAATTTAPLPQPDGSEGVVRFTMMVADVGRDGKAWADAG
ncbi:unnamed protein product [Urochloa humidicola]